MRVNSKGYTIKSHLGLLIFVFFIGVFTMAGIGCSNGDYIPVTLKSIEVTPAYPSVPLGLTQQFTATGIYSDDSTQDITDQVTWDSSDPSKVTISNNAGFEGLATTLAVGTTTIGATFDGITGATVLTVTDAELVSIEVTPANPSVPIGIVKRFVATGVYTNGSAHNITTRVDYWTSSDISVAVMNPVGGLAISVAEGETTISATLDGITGSTVLTVTPAELVYMQILPLHPSVPVNLTQQFTAIGAYEDSSTQDITDQVTWDSSDPSKATISNDAGSEGLATTVGVGTTTISAALDGITGATMLTGTPAELVSIEVTPANPSVPLGLTRQFTAIGTYDDSSTQDITNQITWYSSDRSKAVISNAAGSEGLVITVGVGTTTIRATLAFGGITGATVLTVADAELAFIEVTPADPSVPLGSTQQFTAAGTYTNGVVLNLTNHTTWYSSDELVARISNADESKGIATTLAEGTTTISATRDGVTGSTDLEVY